MIGWLSITSYVDFGRTFYLLLATYYLVEYIQEKKNSKLYISAIMLGFAVTVKVLSGVDVFVFIFLLIGLRVPIKNIVKFGTISLLVPLPWFIFSYVNTGNIVYPFFSEIYPVTASFSMSNIFNFIRREQKKDDTLELSNRGNRVYWQS